MSDWQAILKHFVGHIKADNQNAREMFKLVFALREATSQLQGIYIYADHLQLLAYFEGLDHTLQVNNHEPDFFDATLYKGQWLENPIASEYHVPAEQMVELILHCKNYLTDKRGVA